MNNKFLSMNDFDEDRLNISSFTNISKATPEKELRSKFPEKEYNIFSKAVVLGWSKSIIDSTGGKIEKGGFNDTPEINEIVANANKTISKLQKVLVKSQDGELLEMYVMKKDDEIENTNIEKSKKDNEIKKALGDITDSVRYGDFSKILFKKTGAEIKEKLNVIKLDEEKCLDDLKKEILDLSTKLTISPDEKTYGFDDHGYNTFRWELTWRNDDNKMVSYDGFNSGMLTEEQCEQHKQWNGMIYKLSRLLEELKSIKLLENNLNDKESYELTAKEMMNFGF